MVSCISTPRKTKKTHRIIYGALIKEDFRREWDLNPRMSVLQTDALGHLAIPPKLACGAEYTGYGRIRQAKIEFFLSFL